MMTLHIAIIMSPDLLPSYNRTAPIKRRNGTGWVALSAPIMIEWLELLDRA